MEQLIAMRVVYPVLARALPICLLALAVFALSPLFAFAEGWQADIPDAPTTPRRILAVDKAAQTFHIIERQSPPAVVASFPCTTGSLGGDKQIEGDKKTPEGVYFIERKVDSGLDRELYGGIAYTLNYPNPVDRLRGKTGYGIWIHSKGRAIVPMETQGCIALNLPDIGGIGHLLERGTPVAVAQQIVMDAGSVKAQQTRQADKAARLTQEWVRAWSSRSADMFALYDPIAYTRAQSESFAAFKAQKEQLFKKLPWIHTFATDMQTMAGPGYWVTWFNQYYRAPNLITEGVRRLYWTESAGGDLRIVGMEWQPAPLGLENRYMDEYVRPSLAAFVSDWRAAWEKGDLAAYMSAYDADARQGNRRGAAAIQDQKQGLWKVTRPAKVEFSEPDIQWTPEGLTVQMRQFYKDSSGYSDKGIKSLLVAPEGSGWAILREDWRAAAQ